MLPIELAELARRVHGAVGDRRDDALTVTGRVTTDSREVGPGDLYVAIRGDRHDGHAFVAQARERGAVAVLAAAAVEAPHVLVHDTVHALGLLARSVVRDLPGLAVVGLTGSAGKTTTKDLLAQVLSAAGPTTAPVGSYNNEIGVPLTALGVDATTRYLILELGARGPGHIAYLTELVPPRIGLVLNVGSAHVGEFGGKQRTAQAKGELVEALPAAGDGGVAVLNADDPLVLAMRSRTAARVVTFGTAAGADVRAESVVDDSGAARFELVSGGSRAPVALRVVGRHQVSNALAAAAVALALGVDLDRVAGSLSRADRRSPGRMEILERADGVTVVNDAYNANPESMVAAMDAVISIAGDRRTVMVLGEMLELGGSSETEHRRIGQQAAGHGPALVLAVGGRDAEALAEASGGRRVDSREAAAEVLQDFLQPGDVVLVKASNAFGLQRLARDLAAAPGKEPAGR